MSLLPCSTDIPPYDQNVCEIEKLAAISQLAFLKPGQTTITDYTNATQWQSAIANGDAVITGKLMADLPDGAPIQIDNKRACGPAQKQVGVDYTLTVIDPNVSAENDAFWTGINGKTYTVVPFYCEENEIRVLETVQVSARIPQAVGNGSDTQHYNVTLSWRYGNDNFGELLNAPAGIFG
jgi:hypothetical protein